METIAVVTKGTTNADLPYLDEQIFTIRKRGKTAMVIITVTVLGSIGTDTTTFNIEGGEFFTDASGATSLGTSISAGAGANTMYVMIYVDFARLRFRKSEFVGALGTVGGGGALWALCEGKTADDFQSPYMEVYLNDLPVNISTLATYSPSGNISSRAACVHIGDINTIADYPLIYCSIDSRSDNGMYPLNQLSGKLTRKLPASLYYFALFPTFQAKAFINDQFSVDLNVLADSTTLTVCNICTVNVSGDLSALANKPNMTEIVIDRSYNDVTGNLSALANKNPLITCRISSDKITGSLNSIPGNAEIIHLMYMPACTAYTTRSWGTRMQSVQLNNMTWQSSTQLGLFLQNLTTITTWAGWKNVIVKGTLDATGTAAVTNLQGKGVAVTVINP